VFYLNDKVINMNIIFHGQSFFEVQIKAEGKESDVIIAVDPFDESIGLKVPKVKASVLLITHNHKDHSNKKTIISDDLFVIETPGEYEVKGVYVKGIEAFHDQTEGKERGSVVVYKIEAEGISLCHLGDLGQKELTPEQVEAIGEVDVLLVPVGGNYTIAAKEAAGIAAQIEPRIIIPMHYKLPNLKVDLDGVDKFLKQMGQESQTPEKKLKLTTKSMPTEETKVILLEP